MKSSTKALSAVGVVCLGLGSIGCVHSHETHYKEDDRVSVEFENETAGRTFYESFSRRGHHRDATERSTTVQLPFVFSHEYKVLRGRNSEFTRAVAECDTNRDGRITEMEARIYGDRQNP